MHRTTIYLDRDLEMRLRAEARRRDTSMAELIREALREKFTSATTPRSPHAGAFAAGRDDVASRVDEVLDETGYGRD
jgi:predicted transcriptional regulator